MNETLQAPAKICKEHPLDGKILFVSSCLIGDQLVDSLTRSGTPWINVQVIAADGFAPVGKAKSSAGRRPCPFLTVEFGKGLRTKDICCKIYYN